MNTLRWLKVVALYMLMLVVLLAAFAGSASAQSDEPACEGDYLESVRKIGLTYIDALNTGDLEPWYALLADDLEHYEGGDFAPWDKAASRASAEETMAIFPGFQTEVHMSTVSADCRFVTFTWTSTANFNGPMGDIQPTGQETSVSGISITEVIDGKITREWISYDQLTLLAKLGLVTIAAPAAAEEENTLSEEAMMTFAEQFDAIFDGPNLAIADEILSPDLIGHLPLAPVLDREGWKNYVASFYAGISDLTEEVNEVIISEDRLVLRVTYTGTHDGTLFGIPATGNPIMIDGIGIFRFDENGLVAENWAVIDVVGVLAQIGGFPPPQ